MSLRSHHDPFVRGRWREGWEGRSPESSRLSTFRITDSPVISDRPLLPGEPSLKTKKGLSSVLYVRLGSCGRGLWQPLSAETTCEDYLGLTADAPSMLGDFARMVRILPPATSPWLSPQTSSGICWHFPCPAPPNPPTHSAKQTAGAYSVPCGLNQPAHQPACPIAKPLLTLSSGLARLLGVTCD